MAFNLFRLLCGSEAGRARLVGDVVACPDCGRVQRLPGVVAGGSIRCQRCESPLERTNGRSLDAALACSLATFLLLFPANLLPLLRVDILQAANRSVILSGAAGIWRQGWPLTAVTIGLEIFLLPFVRFGLLTIVLGALWLGRRPPWLGPAFRWSERLAQWALIDVFLFGGIIGYTRIAPFLPVQIEAGGWCVIAASLLALATQAALERRALWRRIGPVAHELRPGMIGCACCDYPVPAEDEGRRCPRCRAVVWRYRRYSVMRAVALTLAGFVFYPAAYFYPMEYSIRLNQAVGYTIMTGVRELIQANLWFFAIVIFCFSVITPLLKLAAFAWFATSIRRRSNSRLRLKTRLFRIVDEIGRWSHIDVFTVSVFLPLMYLPGFLDVAVGRALPAFLAVVVLTMLASRCFDPRALWRAEEEGS